MRKITIAVAACVLSLGLLAQATHASPLISQPDPNDTAGALDIEVIAGVKDRVAAPLQLGVRTFHAWHDALLKTKGPDRIFILFNINKDSDAEYVGEISTTDGKMTMTITGKGDTLKPIAVTRVDGRTIRVSIPRNSPANPRGAAKIAIRTTLTKSSGPCSSVCEDRGPDKGWLTIAP